MVTMAWYEWELALDRQATFRREAALRRAVALVARATARERVALALLGLARWLAPAGRDAALPTAR